MELDNSLSQLNRYARFFQEDINANIADATESAIDEDSLTSSSDCYPFAYFIKKVANAEEKVTCSFNKAPKTVNNLITLKVCQRNTNGFGKEGETYLSSVPNFLRRQRLPMTRRLPSARSMLRRKLKKLICIIQPDVPHMNKFLLAKSFLHPFIGIYSFSEVSSLLSALWNDSLKWWANDYYTFLINCYLIIDRTNVRIPTLIRLWEPIVEGIPRSVELTPFEVVMRNLLHEKLNSPGYMEIIRKIETNRKQRRETLPRIGTLNLPVENSARIDQMKRAANSKYIRSMRKLRTATNDSLFKQNPPPPKKQVQLDVWKGAARQ